jgi:hypothetical protein
MTKITNQNYPNGLNPLGYMGVNAPTPGQQVVQLNRAPMPTDAQNFTIGTQWLTNVNGTQQIWELVDLTRGVATWVQLYPAGGGGGGASEFPTDSGTANEAGGVLNILGGLNINTTGVGDTVTVNLDTTISVDGIQDTSMGLGVVQSDALGNLTSSNGTTGQVLIAGTGTAPQWNALTAGTNVSINSTVPHHITISAPGLNPASSCTFFYYQATTATDVIGGTNPSAYQMGSSVALTSLYDNTGGAVNPGNGAGTPASFTAPATGIYNLQMTFTTFSSDFNNLQSVGFVIVTGTSAHVYYSSVTGFAESDNTRGNFFLADFSIIVPMTLNDVATWNIWERNPLAADPDDILGNGQIFLNLPSGFRTWISGYRIL